IDSDLSYWRKEVLLLTDEVDRLRKGRERGYASLPEYNRALSAWERASTEEKKLVSQQQITAREQEILKAEIRREQSAFENELVQLDKEIENLELDKQVALQTMQKELTLNRKLLEIQKNDTVTAVGETEADAVIRAEMKGAISEMGFRNPGEYVSVSDLLCTLVPSGSPLFMDITVSNKDVGFIEEGMTVKYKFDAYPSTDYGLLAGKVVFIAPSAVESQAQGFVYHIRGSLPQPYFTIRGRNYPVKAGMTATAEVVTEQISIFSLLFRKLRR
ncbi:MAG: HlyD family efflux transporter periplasmic adaptor subunit, partial [Candidatus Latescibacterota bacterium]